MRNFKGLFFTLSLFLLMASYSEAAELWTVMRGSIKDYYTNIEITDVKASYSTGYSGLNSQGAASYFAGDSDRQLGDYMEAGAKCRSSYYAIDHFDCIPAAYSNGATMAACSANIVCLNIKQTVSEVKEMPVSAVSAPNSVIEPKAGKKKK